MTAPRTLAALIALVPLAAMADGRAATGTLAYPQRIALPPDAMVVVQATGADGAVLAETRQPTNGAQVPLPFSLDLPETTGASLRAAVIVGADVAWLSPAVALADGAGTADLGQVALRPYRAPGLPLRMSCGEVRPAVTVGPAGGRQAAVRPCAGGQRLGREIRSPIRPRNLLLVERRHRPCLRRRGGAARMPDAAAR